jgi:hypothetical protein
MTFNSESGFVVPINGGIAGLADYGTRFRAVFSGVPSGAAVWVTTTNYAGANGLSYVNNPPGGSPTFLFSAITNYKASQAIARLVQSETAADSNGVVPAVSPSLYLGPALTPTELAQVSIVNGSGEAVWEYVQGNPTLAETLDFGVYFTYNGAGSGSLPFSAGTVGLSLAAAPGPFSGFNATDSAKPSAVLQIPRFADTSAPQSLVTVNSCQVATPVPAFSWWSLGALAAFLAALASRCLNRASS